MGILGATWGIGGVLALVGFAIWRLAGPAADAFSHQLGWNHWLVLVANTLLLAYLKGYRGFHRGLAPRVAKRARIVYDQPTMVRLLLAPLFCMGYIQMERKRQVVTVMLTLFMVLMIVLVRQLDQPWRGLIDVGIASVLGIGLLSVLFHTAQVFVVEKPPVDGRDIAMDGSKLTAGD